MATKKPKRFEQGGLSDKDAGLEASKDDKVGFFERLRMGNIDEEGSEAYNRFGAGRGRAERIPVEDRVATPVEKRVPIPMATTPMSTASTGTMRGEEDLAQGRMRTQREMDEERGGAILEKMRDDANKTRVAKPSAPTKSAPTKTSAYPMTSAQPTTKTYERGSGKAPASSLASQIPSGSSTKPVVGEATEPMSDTERQIKNALAATGVGAGAAGAFYKGKKMLDARKAAQQGAKKRAALKRVLIGTWLMSLKTIQFLPQKKLLQQNNLQPKPRPSGLAI